MQDNKEMLTYDDVLDRFLDMHHLMIDDAQTPGIKTLINADNSNKILVPVFGDKRIYNDIEWMTTVNFSNDDFLAHIAYFTPWWISDTSIGNSSRFFQSILDISKCRKIFNPIFKCKSLEEMMIKLDLSL